MKKTIIILICLLFFMKISYAATCSELCAANPSVINCGCGTAPSPPMLYWTLDPATCNPRCLEKTTLSGATDCSSPNVCKGSVPAVGCPEECSRCHSGSFAEGSCYCTETCTSFPIAGTTLTSGCSGDFYYQWYWGGYPCSDCGAGEGCLCMSSGYCSSGCDPNSGCCGSYPNCEDYTVDCCPTGATDACKIESGQCVDKAAQQCGTTGAYCGTVLDPPCCPGLTCSGGFCGVEPSCSGTGEWCSYDGDCCYGLICRGNMCTTCSYHCTTIGYGYGGCYASPPAPGTWCSSGSCISEITTESGYCSGSNCYCFNLMDCDPECSARCSASGCAGCDPDLSANCCNNLLPYPFFNINYDLYSPAPPWDNCDTSVVGNCYIQGGEFYDIGDPPECCGDDNSEYYKDNVGAARCCNNVNDCAISGNCIAPGSWVPDYCCYGTSQVASCSAGSNDCDDDPYVDGVNCYYDESCTPSSYTAPTQVVCNSAKECNFWACDLLHCIYANSGQYAWVNSIPEETACEDGHDNDCDGKIDDEDLDCVETCTEPCNSFNPWNANMFRAETPTQCYSYYGATQACCQKWFPGVGYLNVWQDIAFYKDTPTKYAMTLYPGWNFISVPIDPLNKNLDSIFSSIISDVNSVYYWDNTQQSFDMWMPGLSLGLSTMEPEKGYMVIIQSSSPVQLTIEGNIITSSWTPTLFTGSNMIGLPCLKTKRISDLNFGTFDRIERYRPGKWERGKSGEYEFEEFYYQDSRPDDFRYLEPGKGYYLIK